MLTETKTFDTRAEWEEARRITGIGSSDAPVILGMSRYKTPFQLYSEKLGLVPSNREETEQLRWGNILEEPIAQRYSEETHRSVRNPKPHPGAFVIERSREVEFMIAQIDRYTIRLATPEEQAAAIVAGGTMPINEEGVLEIKNAHFFMAEDWLEMQEPPAEFQIQLQHQLAVTGLKWGSIACLIGGVKFVWKDLARDDEFIDLLITKEREFWSMLQNHVPPRIDGTEKTKAIIGKLHPKDNGLTIELGVDALELVEERETLKAGIKKAEERVTQIENTLKLAIGPNTAGAFRDGTVVTYKHQSRAGYTVQATEYRQLRVARSKKAK